MNDFRMGEFDIIPVGNEPNYENMSSGILWASDLDTWRMSTASGVREIRTGHGLIQVYRSASAPAQTFIDSITEVVYDNNPIIDEQYYVWDGSGTITVKEPGIYRVSYTNNIDVNTGSARSSSLNFMRLNGTSIPQTTTYGYHRLANGGFDSPGKSVLALVSTPNSDITVTSARVAGTDTLEFITGCDCSLERIGPLRNPGGGGGD